MSKSHSKVKRVNYGLLNKPHNKNIEKTINNELKQGYKLTQRSDHNAGCLKLLLTLGWGRGRTELTFILDDNT